MTRNRPTRLRPSEGGRFRSMGPANPMDVCRSVLAEHWRPPDVGRPSIAEEPREETATWEGPGFTVRELPESVGVTSVAPWEDPVGKGYVHINYYIGEPDPAVVAEQVRAAKTRAIQRRLAANVKPAPPPGAPPEKYYWFPRQMLDEVYEAPSPTVDEELERERRRLVGKRVRWDPRDYMAGYPFPGSDVVVSVARLGGCLWARFEDTTETGARCNMIEPIEEPKPTTFGDLKVGQRFRFVGDPTCAVCRADERGRYWWTSALGDEVLGHASGWSDVEVVTDAG